MAKKNIKNWTRQDYADVRSSVLSFLGDVRADVMAGHSHIEDEAFRLPSQVLEYMDGSGYNTDPALLDAVLADLVRDGYVETCGVGNTMMVRSVR